MKLHTRNVVVALAVLFFIAAVGFRSYATARGVPLLEGDACVFLPQTVPYHNNGELTNAVWKPSTIDVSGRNRMVYHGFLYPMILSKLMWRGDYPTLVAVLGILHGFAALFFCILLWNFTNCWKWELTHGRLLSIVFLATAGANYTQSSIGRPEPMAALILMLSAMLVTRTQSAWHGPIAGLTIGLVAAVDPIIGVFSGFVFAAYAGWRLPIRSAIAGIATAASFSGMIFACCFLLYPYPFADWWAGTLRMGGHALQQGAQENQGLVYLKSYLSPSWFLMGTIPLVIWSGIRIACRQIRSHNPPRCPFLFYALLLASGALFCRFVLYVPHARYNVVPFMPIGFIAVLYELGHSPKKRAIAFSAYQFTAFAILAVATLGFANDLYQRAHALRFGLDLREARDLFASLRVSHPKEVFALHSNLFTLTEDYSRIAFWSQLPPPTGASILLDAQSRGNQVPAAIEGFTLVSNHFNPRRPYSFHHGLQKDCRSGFAVYFRDESRGQ